MDLFYDLHIHSCLSPCGDNDMTPYNLVNMAKIMGLDIIALTDHNTCKNCPAALAVGECTGLTVVPGMELCTSEEVHIVCLFGDLKGAMAFSDFVETTIPKVKNRKEIFGEQLIMDESDNILGEFNLLLTTASSISIDRAADIVKSFGGICYPAHIDRNSYSVLSNLGSINPEMGFTCAEITAKANVADYLSKYSILKSMQILTSSDAHYLANISEAERTINIKDCTSQSLVKRLGL